VSKATPIVCSLYSIISLEKLKLIFKKIFAVLCVCILCFYAIAGDMALIQEVTEKEGRRKIVERINAMSSKWNFDYPLDPQLQYVYPAPTVTILTNIVNALAAVPKFYVQVLHLMNKMNLPAPFGLQTLTPPIPHGIPPPLPPETDKPPEPDVLDREDMEFSSSEESELESDTENVRKVSEAEPTKRLRKREHQSSRKKLRLQIQMQAQMQAITGVMPKPVAPTQNVKDVFEQPQPATAKKIEIVKIGSEASSQPDASASELQLEQDVEPEAEVVVGGFGKLLPERREQVESEDEEDEEWGQRDFISSRRLRRGRLSEKERSQLDVFKNYNPGDPTSRLYIKNLSKKATEKDLHYIFGRYIDWNVETEKSMFYVQLLTGRMKGQAFVTLPSEQSATDALEDTNGFQLHGKPIVVQFARSAKPKEKAVASDS